MSQTNLNPAEYLESLTGFEEIAVAKAFGEDPMALKERPSTLLRALVFVDHKRQGKRDPEAKQAALELTIGDLGNYFADEEPDLDPDDPDTDEGKDDSPSA